jgi:hypothetical protein
VSAWRQGFACLVANDKEVVEVLEAVDAEYASYMLNRVKQTKQEWRTGEVRLPQLPTRLHRNASIRQSKARLMTEHIHRQMLQPRLAANAQPI